MTSFFPQKLNHSSKRATDITAAISYFICKDMRPYSVVENEGFPEQLQTLELRYSVPSRQYFRDTCLLRLYSKVKDEVKSELAKAERVAITTDGWTSCTTEAYVTVTCHFIDNTWEMKNYVLVFWMNRIQEQILGRFWMKHASSAIYPTKILLLWRKTPATCR